MMFHCLTGSLVGGAEKSCASEVPSSSTSTSKGLRPLAVWRGWGEVACLFVGPAGGAATAASI